MQTVRVDLANRSYDIYIAEAATKTVLDGPVSLEAATGEVFEAVLLDRVDPALAEFRFFPTQ